MSQTIAKRNTIIAVVLVAIVAVGATYGLMSAVIPPSLVTVTETAKPAIPVKFCGSMHLSGRNAESGTWVRDAWMLWADYMNERYGGLLGQPIQIIVYDDGSDADRVVANLERCITVDETDQILGTNGSWAVYPALVVTEKYKKMMITGQGGAPRIFADRKPLYYAFSQPGGADIQPRITFKFFDSLPEAQRPKTIAIAQANDVMGEGVRDVVVAQAAEHKLTIVYNELFPMGQPDLTSFALAIKATAPDFVFVGGATQDGANWAKAIQQVGLKAKGIWGLNTVQNPEWLLNIGDIVEGWFGPAGWYPTANTYQNQLFQTLWKAKYKIEATSDAAETWAATQMWTQMVNATQSWDPDVLANYLHSTPFNTLYGPNQIFDQYGKPQGDYIVAQAQKRVGEIVFPADVATAKAIWPAAGAPSPSLPVDLVAPELALATVPTTKLD